MQRAAALAVCLALAGTPACAHQQITNQDVAATVVGVGALVGILVLYGLIADCEHNGNCRHSTN